VWSYVAGGATGSLAEYSATIGTAWLFDETESVSYNPYDAAAFTVGGALTGGLIYGAGVVWQKTTNLAAGQFRQEAAATIQKAINGLRGQTQGTALPNKAVIGRLNDITPNKLREGESTLLKHMQGDLGSPKLNWKRNSSVLRQEMNKGLPIRDASLLPSGELAPHPNTFFDMERNLLKILGWIFDTSTGLWRPPTP